MTNENTGETTAQPDGQDALIKRAVALSEREGVPLSEAMTRVEAAIARPGMDPGLCMFTVTFKLKPRIATWLRKVMPPTETHSTEDRIAAWMPFVVGRAYKENRDLSKEQPPVGKGGAVTYRGKLEEGGQGANVDVTS